MLDRQPLNSVRFHYLSIVRYIPHIFLFLLFAACGDSKDSSAPSEKSEKYDPSDTLAHGIEEEFQGVVIDTINLSTRTLFRTDQKRYRQNTIEAPVPDLVPVTTVIRNTPGADTFDLALKLRHKEWQAPLIYPPSIKAQKPSTPVSSSYDIRSFGVENGMPSASTRNVFLDDHSNMWVSVHNKGVVRYDGYSFLHITADHGLVSNDVQHIFQDSKGNMWFSTKNGLSKFDGQTFTNYLLEEEGQSWFTEAAEDQNGQMWFTSWGFGLIELRSDGFYSYGREQGAGGDILYCVKIAPDGAIWMGNRNNGLGIYKNGTFEIYPADSIPLAKSVRAIDFDKKGNAWLGTEPGMVYFDYQNDHFLDYTKTPFLGEPLVWATMVDSEGRMWSACYNRGIFSFDGETVTSYGLEEGLNSMSSRSFVEDNHGVIWMSTDNGGVNILNPHGFEYIEELDTLENINIQNSIWYKDELWVNVYSQATAIIKDDQVSVVSGVGNGLWRDFFIDSQDDLWIAGLYNLYRYNGEDVIHYDLRPFGESATVRSIAEDNNGTMWFGRESGLMKYEEGEFTKYDQVSGFTSVSVTSLLSSGDNLWMGTAGSGLYKHSNNTFKRFSAAEGLGNSKVECLYKKADDLWIGTDGGGIYRMGKDEKFEHFGVADGLSDGYIKSFREDQRGRLWISTENGITIWDGERFIAHTNQSGLNIYQFRRNSVETDNHENIWWGTSRGLVKINANRYEPDTVAPTVKMNDVLIEQQQVDYRDLKLAIENDEAFITEDDLDLSSVRFDSLTKFQNAPHGLILPHTISQVTMNFASPDINGAQQFQYTYLLEGASDEWSPLSKNNFATFNNLSHGSYLFKVKAQNQYGIWSDELVYPFTIRTPWWKTSWAYFLWIFIFVGTLYSLYRLRVSTYRKRQAELENTVANRTAELKKQKEQVEHQHLEITDSIAYAQRIQEAILPKDKHFAEQLAEGFILYKPKDIVAGDFYWLQTVGDKILYAVADCTGHGVPGAMVSVVCNGALNRSVREYGLTDPGQILDKTREIVITEFEKSRDDVRDGMDIALISLEGHRLAYAGAHNPLWIIREGEIIELKANKEPIGKYDGRTPYTTHQLDLKKGDTLYAFSDGYVDQFGGEARPGGRPGGKKFKAKALRNLLLSIQDLDMDEQKKAIDDALEDWRGNLEQVDDICMIGVRVL